MGEHKLGSIMRTLAKTLTVEGKRISNHSTRKAVVAKLKKAGQPRHNKKYRNTAGFELTPCQFLLRQPLLCFRAMHRRYRQQLLFHCPLIKRLSSSQIPVSRSANDPAAQHFNNCTVNTQNYFGPQSTNQASSSREECQIGEIPRSPSVSVRKRRRAYIIDSDEDWTYYWL